MTKRLFDFCFSLSCLLVLSPLFLLISIGVLFTSRGPVFYRQMRVGKDGYNFKIFKFRTMHILKTPGLPVTKNNDNRITGFGKILRASKLDELPQLFNVLIGHMSVVGPRPEIPELVAFYTPEQRKLLSVKPGITSPATIYHRDEEEIVGTDDEIFEYHKNILVPKKATFDLAYVEKVSFFYDLQLILLTLISVMTNQSGYMREHALKRRRLLILFVHIFISGLTYFFAFLLRFDGTLPYLEFVRFQKTVAVIIVVKFVFLSLFGLTHGYWRYVGLKDVFNIFKATVSSIVCFFILEYIFLDPAFPTGVIIIDGILSLILFTGLRFSTRFLREAYYPITPKSTEKVLILGASDRGEAFLRDLNRDPDLAYEVAGFIDLDSNKRGFRIHGKKILGTIESLEGILRSNDITAIINTYPTLSRQDTIALSSLSARYNVKIKTIPSISDVLAGRVNLNKLRELKYEDLLGREEVQLNKSLLEKIYRNKTILITGAGGSIGSELVRQIIPFFPHKLLLLDKDETLLYDIQTELDEMNCAIDTQVLIGDIRHIPKMELLFKKFKPQIVLHAAAYKHVPLMEEHPQEAISNNVIATRNLLTLSSTYKVNRFVMISTDKAVRPTNVMGASKALSERVMFEFFARQSQMKCMAVRFGNVLGSRGSVIPIFKRQIEKGGPIRITHQDISRYFMSIPEASQLVLQAGAMGDGGEIFILKMGDPVKIRDLAFQMIEYSGLLPEVDIPVVYSGLRPGEKMQEELLTDLENTQTTEHKKIFVLHQTVNTDLPLTLEDISSIEENLYTKTNKEIRTYLQRFVSDYIPKQAVD
ncbi:MAG: polysaccharide biosynthesis protein [Fibrobacteria bacterium]|nr:polysaccharide biosynthesis protein [Fibrobacteria bacterium]